MPGRTLDSLSLPPIDICKMDIEGSELSALAGMKETIARSPRLRLFVEYCSDFGDCQPLLDYLNTNFAAWQVIGAARNEILPLCNILANPNDNNRPVVTENWPAEDCSLWPHTCGRRPPLPFVQEITLELLVGDTIKAHGE